MMAPSMKIHRDHILIAGIPATGKSFFCRWLAREHKYEHWDFDVMLVDPSKYQQALQPLMGALESSTPDKMQGFLNQLQDS